MISKETYQVLDLIGKFLNNYLPKIRNMSQRTIDTYKNSFQSYTKFLSKEYGIKLSSITFDHFNSSYINAFIKQSIEQKIKPSTINLKLATFKSFAKYVLYEDIGLASLCSRLMAVKYVKENKANTVQYLTKKQIKLLFSIPDQNTPLGLRDLVFMILAYETGARVSEMINIRLNNIKSTDSGIVIYLCGKGNKLRQVPLLKDGYKFLQLYLKRFHSNSYPDDFLFYTNYGGKKTQMARNTVHTFLRKYGDEAYKIDSSFPENLHCHMLRHSIATHMYQRDVNISIIKDFLGHSSITSTSIYAHADDAIIRRNIKKVNSKRNELMANQSLRHEDEAHIITALSGLKES